MPITSCEAERSFSALRRTVSYLRSSMSEERLAGLTLMHLHRDVRCEMLKLKKLSDNSVKLILEDCLVVKFCLNRGFNH